MNTAKSITLTAAGVALAAALGGCAASPIPNEKIAVAQASVERAERSGAQELAPVDLASARDKLQRAQKAASDHDARPAIVLAEQANVDAELAEATAQEHRSHQAEQQLEASLDALRRQSQSDSPPAAAPGPQPLTPQPANPQTPEQQ